MSLNVTVSLYLVSHLHWVPLSLVLIFSGCHNHWMAPSLNFALSLDVLPLQDTLSTGCQWADADNVFLSFVAGLVWTSVGTRLMPLVPWCQNQQEWYYRRYITVSKWQTLLQCYRSGPFDLTLSVFFFLNVFKLFRNRSGSLPIVRKCLVWHFLFWLLLLWRMRRSVCVWWVVYLSLCFRVCACDFCVW